MLIASFQLKTLLVLLMDSCRVAWISVAIQTLHKLCDCETGADAKSDAERHKATAIERAAELDVQARALGSRHGLSTAYKHRRSTEARSAEQNEPIKPRSVKLNPKMKFIDKIQLH